MPPRPRSPRRHRSRVEGRGKRHLPAGPALLSRPRLILTFSPRAGEGTVGSSREQSALGLGGLRRPGHNHSRPRIGLFQRLTAPFPTRPHPPWRESCVADPVIRARLSASIDGPPAAFPKAPATGMVPQVRIFRNLLLLSRDWGPEGAAGPPRFKDIRDDCEQQADLVAHVIAFDGIV